MTASLGGLGAHLSAGTIAVPIYLRDAEPLARLAAASGAHFDVRRCAAVLDLKALELRRAGDHAASVAAHAECVTILNRLADQGDDQALAFLVAISCDVSPAALIAASLGLQG